MPLDRELFHVFLVSISPQALQLQHPANCFPFFPQGRLHCAIYPCTAKSASRVPHSGKVATGWAPPLTTTTHAQSTSTVDDRVKELNSNIWKWVTREIVYKCSRYLCLNCGGVRREDFFSDERGARLSGFFEDLFIRWLAFALSTYFPRPASKVLVLARCPHFFFPT